MAGDSGPVIIRARRIGYGGEPDLAAAGRALLKIAAERRA
ncbi:MAG: hypothetical protein JWP73_2688 [Phenylobacterium sp.]|nr:hypothetical protein [Phenylobacterium sp.]